MKFISDKKIAIFYFLAATIIISVLIVFYINTERIKSTNILVEHTEEVLRKSDNVLLDIINIETGSRGYVLTGNVLFLEPFYKAHATINNNLANLLLLTKDNTAQQLRVDSLNRMVYERLGLTQKMIDAKKVQMLDEKVEILLMEKGKIITDKIRATIAEINSEELGLLKLRKIDNQISTRNAELIFILLIFFLIIIFVLVIVIIRNQKINHKNQENIAHLATIVQFSDDAIISKSSEGIIISWNMGAEKMFGYSAKQTIGKNISLIIPPEYSTEEANILERVNNNEIIDHYETVRVKKGGEQIYVSLTVSPLKDHTGKIISISKIARDITDQKKSALYARNLIEASLDPLITISSEGKITDMNEALIRITSKTREELTGSDFFDYFTEPQKAREVYQEVFAKSFVADFPLTLCNNDGNLTDVLFNGSVYKDNKGKVLGVVVVARDITDQKKIATELSEAIVFADEAKFKAESATLIAESAVKSKQQFLSNMSHEIRTPMNAIIGFTKVLLKTKMDTKQIEYLEAIKLSGDALIVLINDILDLAKVDAGKMIFQQSPFKMALSISAMLHLFEPKIREKNLILIKEYDDTIPEVLLGDPVRLHQIILNLVSNAVKFTNKGKITVKVSLLKEDDKNVTINFSIKDTGIGIEPNKIEKIFENFQQATSGTSRLYGGTGLGLAIVKQLVEAQNGTIKVESALHEGATFSFILNFKKTKDTVETNLAIMELDTEMHNINVLVVEDIALNQLLMKTVLEDFGFTCDIASNGKIAIDKMQTNMYDIILMDLQMPEMNGFEATDYIRNTLKSNIPIIALTADVTTVDLAKCTAVGMDDYIAKPVDEQLLYKKIVGSIKKIQPIDSEIVEIKTEMKTIKYTNLDYLTRRTKSNTKLMIEMISLYLEQTPPLISTIKQSWKQQDWDLLYASIHKMIPSFSIMGISVDFENMAKKVQEFANTQQHLEEISDLIIQLDIVCTQACVELEIELNTMKNKEK